MTKQINVQEDYYFKSRVAEREIQKTLFWKHIIITIFICFTVCFAIYHIKDWLTVETALEAEVGNDGNINIIDNILGDING